MKFLHKRFIGGLKTNYENKPFTKLLKSGIREYELFYFNIKVLKDFMEDPRYYISNFHDRINISIKTEYDYSEKINKGEKIILDNVGIGFDENNERIIAIFLKQLSALPSEMQQIFNARRNTNTTYLDPSFINSINGKWSNEISIFDAIIYEIRKINKIFETKKYEKLFENEFQNKLPEQYNLILLPTKKEYYEFISSFDKIIYDNCNKIFFKTKIDKNWKTIKKMGFLNLLEEWLKKIGIENKKIIKIKDLIDTVRQERNIYSHEHYENNYDENYYTKQVEMLINIYDALKLLINVLITYFNINEPKLEKWFVEDKIRTYSIEEIKQEKNKNYNFMK